LDDSGFGVDEDEPEEDEDDENVRLFASELLGVSLVLPAGYPFSLRM
jgi:hypothetical protein